MLSGEVPRAVKRAVQAGAPSTPGGLGYLVAERLMYLSSVCSCSFPGVCAPRAFPFLSVSGDLRANGGISRKMHTNFYNLTNISPAVCSGVGW